MTQIQKLIFRFLSRPKDFSFEELTKLLKHFGYEEVSNQKTGGSRRAFRHRDTRQIIRLHKPHPQPVLKQYQLKEMRMLLQENGYI